MKNREILFVDDEKNMLDAITRQLRNTFNIDTAQSGKEALAKFKTNGSYSVIVSDLRMPGMDGFELLSNVKKLSPDTIRIILTGDADLDSAIQAVNNGQVFRFLTKPCSTNSLVTTLTLAENQYEMMRNERELLNKTLKGSINMLCELLSLSNPRAFSKGNRIKPIVSKISKNIGLKPLWQYEIAALVCQVGCIAVPTDILNKVSLGEPLNSNEKKMFEDHPRIGAHLVGKIPRLESISKMIRFQLKAFDQFENLPENNSHIILGSQILKAAIDYDFFIIKGNTHQESLRILYSRQGQYNPDILAQFNDIAPYYTKERLAQNLLFDELVPGMTAAEDILAKNGTLIIAKNQEITWPVLQGLQNFIDHIGIKEPMKIWVE